MYRSTGKTLNFSFPAYKAFTETVGSWSHVMTTLTMTIVIKVTCRFVDRPEITLHAAGKDSSIFFLTKLGHL